MKELGKRIESLKAELESRGFVAGKVKISKEIEILNIPQKNSDKLNMFIEDIEELKTAFANSDINYENIILPSGYRIFKLRIAGDVFLLSLFFQTLGDYLHDRILSLSPEKISPSFWKFSTVEEE